MKTLLFAPLFLDEPGRMERNIRWIEYYRDLKDQLGYDEILMVDNASTASQVERFVKLAPEIEIINRVTRLKKVGECGYGYWYRAQALAAAYALARGYDKIIHIDTDAYVLTPRFCSFINSIETGWHTVWCDYWQFPEVNIQVIGKNSLESMLDFHSDAFLSFYPFGPAEKNMPFTDVHKQFHGDRYGEMGVNQQPYMDYYCQAKDEDQFVFNMGKEIT